MWINKNVMLEMSYINQILSLWFTCIVDLYWNICIFMYHNFPIKMAPRTMTNRKRIIKTSATRHQSLRAASKTFTLMAGKQWPGSLHAPTVGCCCPLLVCNTLYRRLFIFQGPVGNSPALVATAMNTLLLLPHYDICVCGHSRIYGFTNFLGKMTWKINLWW